MRLGLTGIRFWPCQRRFNSNSISGEIEISFGAFVRSDERFLPIGLFDEKCVADGFVRHALHAVETRASHGIDGQGKAALRSSLLTGIVICKFRDSFFTTDLSFARLHKEKIDAKSSDGQCRTQRNVQAMTAQGMR